MISPFIGRFKVTSPMGNRVLYGREEYHPGLDLVGLDDITVYAIADGVIEATPYEPGGFGYYIRQILPNGRKIYYGHLRAGSILVKAGQSVKIGDKLGIMGSTGNSTGAHTHIEIRYNGVSEDIVAFTNIPNVKGEFSYNPAQTEEKEEIVEKVVEEEMTQEQFNQMMTNYIVSLSKNGPSTWSSEAREWAEEMGLIQGDQYGNKQYKKFATREEMTQILFRLWKELEEKR